MRVSAQDNEVRQVCQIMDLQVTQQFNYEQAERYWLNVINSLSPETIAMALAIKLPEYSIKQERAS